MSAPRGRPPKRAWASRKLAAEELRRSYKNGAAALRVSETTSRAQAEARHFVEAMHSARVALRIASKEVEKAAAALWRRRDAVAWTNWGHEVSYVHAESGEVAEAMKALRVRTAELEDEALRVWAFLKGDSRAGRRRNEVRHETLRRIREVAPDVARSGTAMAYWETALYGTPPRSSDEFATLVAKWTGMIKRSRR